MASKHPQHPQHLSVMHHVHTASEAIAPHDKHVLPHSHSDSDTDNAIVSTPMLRKRDLMKIEEGFYSSTNSLTWAGQQSLVLSSHVKGTGPEDASPADGAIIAPTGRVTFQLTLAAFIAAFGSSLPHGWNTGVLNTPSELIIDFLNTTYAERFGHPPEEQVLNLLWSISVSIYLVGGCGGAFCAGWMANTVGRKKALLICHVFGFVSAIMFATCKVASSFEMLIIARLIVGFGCGAGSGLVPMYLIEIAPVNIRGAMGVVHQLALTCGILLSQVMGLRQILGQEHLWPYLLALTGVPCLISCIMLPFVPESPRYLYVNQEDVAAAEHALRVFRQEDDVTLDLDEMKQEVTQQKQEPQWTFKQLFKDKRLSMQLLLVCVLAVAQQLSGINVVFYYSTMIFIGAGIPEEYTQYATLGTGIINVLMTGISVPLMEKVGRRKLLLGGMIGMVISASAITLALNLKDIVPWMSYFSIIALIGFVIGFAIGLGSIPQFIGAELFKQGPRPPAMSFAGLLNWLCNVIVGITFPLMAPYTKAFSFIPFIVMVIGFGAFLWWKLPETKGKTYDDIAKYFSKDDTGIEDETLLVQKSIAKAGDNTPKPTETQTMANKGDTEMSHITSNGSSNCVHT